MSQYLLYFWAVTAASIKKVFISELSDHYGHDEAAAITWMVMSHVCRVDRTRFLLTKDQPLPEDQENSLQKILLELQKGIPVQYVLGEADFYGMRLNVNSSVLIPRPETEELVDWILEDFTRNGKGEGLNIIDLGTGSGCIPIALKRFMPEATVSATDISSSALDLARSNANNQHLDILFLQNDMLRNTITETFDIIVSNPPYITIAEKSSMAPHVLEYEPHQALFVYDEDPLLFYRAVAAFAMLRLSSRGALYFEINEQLGRAMSEMLRATGFRDITLRTDLSGKDRMIRAQI